VGFLTVTDTGDTILICTQNSSSAEDASEKLLSVAQLINNSQQVKFAASQPNDPTVGASMTTPTGRKTTELFSHSLRLHQLWAPVPKPQPALWALSQTFPGPQRSGNPCAALLTIRDPDKSVGEDVHAFHLSTRTLPT
jgi:hypothetical protein